MKSSYIAVAVKAPDNRVLAKDNSGIIFNNYSTSMHAAKEKQKAGVGLMERLELLRNFDFFSELDESDLYKIAEISLEKKYKKNMLIFMEGDPGECFYFILSGKVKVFRTYEDGKEHIIHIFGEGDVFGEATLFTNVPYPASASVYEDAVIGVIKNKDMEELVTRNPDLALKLLEIFAKKLIFAQQKIRDLTFNDVFSRTASQLLKLAHDYGRQSTRGILIDVQLPRQELAEMVGTTRETISRVISKLKKEKSISEEDDRILILNSEKLKEWI
jgi:CRP/FNR family cyclic AMP-dependent transcriptional regulator